jgi:hypothetical protein
LSGRAIAVRAPATAGIAACQLICAVRRAVSVPINALRPSTVLGCRKKVVALDITRLLSDVAFMMHPMNYEVK